MDGCPNTRWLLVVLTLYHTWGELPPSLGYSKKCWIFLFSTHDKICNFCINACNRAPKLARRDAQGKLIKHKIGDFFLLVPLEWLGKAEGGGPAHPDPIELQSMIKQTITCSVLTKDKKNETRPFNNITEWWRSGWTGPLTGPLQVITGVQVKEKGPYFMLEKFIFYASPTVANLGFLR